MYSKSIRLIARSPLTHPTACLLFISGAAGGEEGGRGGGREGLFGLMNVCVINLHMELAAGFTFRAVKNHASYLSTTTTTTTTSKAFLISDSNSMMRLLF